MRNIGFVLAIVLISVFVSCVEKNANRNVDEGRIVKRSYTSDEIGWTIEIPKGWDIVEKEKTDEINEKGRKALEESVDEEIDMNGLKNLISFSKNQFNSFQSSSQTFKLEYEGEWEENNIALKKMVYTTFIDRGIKVDSTATTVENIDGLDFQTYALTIYSPKGEVILHQLMYSRYINGNDFGVNLNYNNDKDGDVLLRAFRSSKFKK